jgi:hypothetical protein
MQTQNQKNRDIEAINHTVELAFEGARLLHELLNETEKKSPVRFQDWSRALIDGTKGKADFVTNSQLIWLWESLRCAPSLCHLFGELPSATVPWSSKTDRYFVFPPGQFLLIGMNSDEVSRLLLSINAPATQERVIVLTEEPVRMRPGKHDRLECCDCKSIVTIRAEKTFGIEREADIMRIEPDRIVIEGQFVKVHVDSLNQAYTVSSRRLEPNRRSHGGRTYDHLVHVDQGYRRKLEAIRCLVESGSWRPESLTEQQILSMFGEPQQWGLRGDPYLWREIRKRFLDYGVSKSLEDFDSELALQFQEMVGVPFTTNQENVFVDRYDKGGMSSGRISPEWWREIGIPLLRERFILLNPMQVIQTPKDSDESN